MYLPTLAGMQLAFSNRTAELKELDAAAAKSGLLVVFGRRRVGKTRLLSHWLKRRNGWYTQAIEGSKEMQIEQAFQDVQERLDTSLVPKSWAEFFELLSLSKRKWVLCLDEFPYLVAADPSLPSVLQRWLDHEQPANSLIILCGSSTRMMNDLFLNRSAPLYGRARKLLHIKPMPYRAFCQARGLRPADAGAFERYSLVGGIPKYWEFVDPKQPPWRLAEELFFGFAPYLDQEPSRILRDEGISGLNALSVLEAIGRGAEKPSEIAARLGTAQTNISRLLQHLLDASVLERDIPFGETPRSTKRTLYRIKDPALRFWFRVYSPHRARWHRYDEQSKSGLVHEHAATVFEDYCRQRYPGAGRYWEKNHEFDLLREEVNAGGNSVLVVSEVKWKIVTEAEKKRLLARLKESWQRTAPAKLHRTVMFEVIDARELKKNHAF